ncbi:MAG: hypothetical protein IKI11_02860 [Neisseriaceae bacterium]|nr:hypothetical protein [Neisseriaceae bacterium]
MLYSDIKNTCFIKGLFAFRLPEMVLMAWATSCPPYTSALSFWWVEDPPYGYFAIIVCK